MTFIAAINLVVVLTYVVVMALDLIIGQILVERVDLTRVFTNTFKLARTVAAQTTAFTIVVICPVIWYFSNLPTAVCVAILSLVHLGLGLLRIKAAVRKHEHLHVQAQAN